MNAHIRIKIRKGLFIYLFKKKMKGDNITTTAEKPIREGKERKVENYTLEVHSQFYYIFFCVDEDQEKVLL